ncbi:MAG TPA: HAD domain-containing protein [Kofleriaceae bacterium]|nr:HAD domain-containing protein [Kofleriaceae bacterium]
MRVLFLDIDGVLNRTGFQPTETLGLRSWIEPELAARLCEVVKATEAQIVLASDWRLNRELAELRDELRAAGIDVTLIGATPELEGQPRWREVEAWMVQHSLDRDAVVIIDDKYDMGPLNPRWVKVSPVRGLDDQAAQRIRQLFEVEQAAS